MATADEAEPTKARTAAILDDLTVDEAEPISAGSDPMAERSARSQARPTTAVSQERLRSRVTWVLSFLTLGAALMAAGLLLTTDPEDEVFGRQPLPGDTTSTIVPSYDVDGDGRFDFAVIEGEVVAMPNRPQQRSPLDVWLPVLGTLVTALIGAIALVIVAVIGGRPEPVRQLPKRQEPRGRRRSFLQRRRERRQARIERLRERDSDQTSVVADDDNYDDTFNDIYPYEDPDM